MFWSPDIFKTSVKNTALYLSLTRRALRLKANLQFNRVVLGDNPQKQYLTLPS